LEDVGRAGQGRNGPVPVLGDARTRGRRDEGCRGRDVERAGPVAAGPGRVDEVVALGPHGEHVLAHRLGAAGDLVRGLALQPQSDQEAADLPRRRLAAHDLAHHGAGLVAPEVEAVQDPRQRLLDHAAASRKFRASSGPTGVSTDSGWNWTPSTLSSRCRTAITSPSAAVAATSSASGTRVAASEW